MGYFYDTSLFHAEKTDKRDKGMNSTSNEKGTDGKKNNTSEYNHEYYMKNKEKWQDNKKSNESKDNDTVKELSDMSGMKEEECQKLLQLAKTKGYDSPEYKELLDSLSEGDPEQYKRMEAVVKKNVGSSDSGEKEFDVDAAARDVIRGKYGNGAERKAALGEDYAEVQKRVNELMKQMNASKTNDSKKSDESKDKKTEKKYVRHMEVAMTNNDWRLYQGDPNYLAHHGIKGQKWGVRRFQNDDGTLTADGRKRYGESSDKIEKHMVKAAKYETKAANAKTAFGREWNASMAYSARSKANAKADKAEGNTAFKNSNNATNWAFGIDQGVKRNAAEAEVRASIAKKMKDRASSEENLKKQSKIMKAAIRNLASAENAETYAKAYKNIAESKGLINKGIKYFEQMNKAGEMKVTPVGRMQSKADKQFEQFGDMALNSAFGLATGGRVGVSSGFVSGIRDRDYEKKNTAEERWNAVLKNHKN